MFRKFSGMFVSLCECMNDSLSVRILSQSASGSLRPPCRKSGVECHALNHLVISRCIILGSMVTVPSISFNDVMLYVRWNAPNIDVMTVFRRPCFRLLSRRADAVLITLR